MPDPFDAYHKWLGIPPKDQPPNHYRLLGLDLFESDDDAINSAADQRMGHVRTFQSGRHAELSQRMLNEIAAARVCLLNAEKKAAYDAELRRELTPAPPPPQPPRPIPADRGAPPTAQPVNPAAGPVPGVPEVVPLPPLAAEGSPPEAVPPGAPLGSELAVYRARRRRRSRQIQAVLGALVALSMGVVLLVLLLPNSSDQASTRGHLPDADGPQQKPPPLSASKQPKENPPTPVKHPKPEPPTKPDGKQEKSQPPVPKPKQPEPPPKEQPPDEPTPLPVPAPADEEAALARLRPAYEGVSADELREAAMAEGRDPVDRFALFCMARDAEVAAGNPQQALDTVDLLAKHFQIDPAEMKTEALLSLAQTAQTPQAFRTVAESCLTVGQEALAGGQPARAVKLAESALTAARQSDDSTLAAKATLLFRKASEAQSPEPPEPSPKASPTPE